jgi:hypothetical protein
LAGQGAPQFGQDVACSETSRLHSRQCFIDPMIRFHAEDATKKGGQMTALHKHGHGRVSADRIMPDPQKKLCTDSSAKKGTTSSGPAIPTSATPRWRG